MKGTSAAACRTDPTARTPDQGTATMEPSQPCKVVSMDTVFPRFSDLFQQLGLPADEAAIRAFIASHRPLPGDVPLHEAPFWSPAQAALLREQIVQDAEWAEVVDHLNVALRD